MKTKRNTKKGGYNKDNYKRKTRRSKLGGGSRKRTTEELSDDKLRELNMKMMNDALGHVSRPRKGQRKKQKRMQRKKQRRQRKKQRRQRKKQRRQRKKQRRQRKKQRRQRKNQMLKLLNYNVTIKKNKKLKY